MVNSRSSCSASARKPTWPRLTPSSGRAALVGQLGRPQDRAVAADDDRDLAVGRRPGAGLHDVEPRQVDGEVGRLVGEEAHGRARGSRGRGRTPPRRAGLLPAGVRDDEDATWAVGGAHAGSPARRGCCGCRGGVFTGPPSQRAPPGTRYGVPRPAPRPARPGPRRAAATGSTPRCPRAPAAGWW